MFLFLVTSLDLFVWCLKALSHGKLHLWPFGNVRITRRWSRTTEWRPFSCCWCVCFPPPPQPIPSHRLHCHHTPSLQNSDNGCCKVWTKHTHTSSLLASMMQEKKKTKRTKSKKRLVPAAAVDLEWSLLNTLLVLYHKHIGTRRPPPPSHPIGPWVGVSRTSLLLESISAWVSHQTWQLAAVTLQVGRQSSSHWGSENLAEGLMTRISIWPKETFP